MPHSGERGNTVFNVTVVCVGNIKEGYLRDALAEYAKRLGAYCRFSVIELKSHESKPFEVDTAELLAKIPPKSYKIALCVEGKQLASEELAVLIDQLPGRGYSELSFIIGGSDGLDEAVKSACDLRLSFSKMTFPHQLMRVILSEQIYRAFTINHGGKYHK